MRTILLAMLVAAEMGLAGTSGASALSVNGAAIGDIARFDAPHKLVGYAGLGASVHSSGEEHYGGRITKQGRRDIRTTMVESAWVAVESHVYWKELFERLDFVAGHVTSCLFKRAADPLAC